MEFVEAWLDSAFVFCDVAGTFLDLSANNFHFAQHKNEQTGYQHYQGEQHEVEEQAQGTNLGSQAL